MNIPSWILSRLELARIPMADNSEEAIKLAAALNVPATRYRTSKGQWIIFERATQNWFAAIIAG